MGRLLFLYCGGIWFGSYNHCYYFQLDDVLLQYQYKEYIRDYRSWHLQFSLTFIIYIGLMGQDCNLMEYLLLSVVVRLV